MKLAVVVLILLFAVAASAQTNSCFPHCHQCEVYVGDLASKRMLKTLKFSPLTGEEELTNQVFRIPGTQLLVTASVFYTDESMASNVGQDSIKLGLAVSHQRLKEAFASSNNAVAEVTLHAFDTARVKTNVWSGSRRLLIGMECKDTSSSNIRKE